MRNQLIEPEAVESLEELLERIELLEQHVQQIMGRNYRVEKDKAWETSNLRVVSIACITYLTTSMVFWIIEVESFLLSALIPTVGYLLSTLTLPAIRGHWARKNPQLKKKASR